jgi:hypothetical protein
MMNRYGYVYEKLYNSMRILVTSQASLKERLLAAWLQHGHLQAERFPPEKRKTWEALKATATTMPPTSESEGRLHASIGALTDDEAKQMAGDLLELFDWVCHERGPQG